MAEIAIAIAAKVVEYLVAPIGRPFGYLFNYRSNIDNLVHQVEKLGDARAGLQRSVDEAIRNGDEIEADVDKWLIGANGFMEEAGKFLEDGKKANKSCFMGLCPNLKLQYKLSRAAKKKAREVVEIQGVGKFERLSYRAPLPGIGSATLRGYEALESRISTLNQIMEALRDGDVNMIGVWGMGGVGKTTLVKQVAKHAKEQKLFDEVVMASVFQNPDLRKIQGQLADMLGLKLEEESEWGRAARLNERIKKEKKILIILDDIWAQLDLEEVGIPFGDDHKGCKIVLTSRNKHVLSNEMGTQKDMPVLHLPEKEALVLFKKIVGDSIDKADLQAIVINVARECAGLPIALVTVAKALKNKSVSIWKDALQQLKRSMPTNIRGMDVMVYSSLELSYRHLHGDEVKSLFLLCGLMDNDIFIDDLLKYVTGLRLFQGTDTLEETRNRIETLVDNLKASNLLLETGDNAFVRMHDVVRDVALAIASKDHVFSLREGVGLEEWPKLDELQSCSKISLAYNDIRKLPEGLVCPELELFVLYHISDPILKIPNTFFEGMKKLKVLDLTNMHFTSLPSSLCCLANLRTLSLDWCILGDIAIIAELKKLESLSLIGSNIEQLPKEIGQLIHLRLLDLSNCSKLQVIPPNIISSLSQLEYLCMENSFTGWEVEGSNDKKTNACLAELKYLSHLVTLDIEVPDAKLLPKDLLFENLIRFKILIGDVWSWCENCETTETLKLNKLNTSLHSMDGISKLLKRVKDLYLRELSGGNHVLSELDREGFPALKHFHVESSPEIQYIMHSVEQVPENPVFPALESLYLTKLINLHEVCHGQLPPGSFGYLRIVKVGDCDGIKCLFSISLARSLPQLQEIEIKRCRVMDEMVEQYGKKLEDGNDVADTILFPQLRSLTLQHLPKLLNVCSEVKVLPSIYVSMKELRSTQVKSEGICLEGEPGTHILLSSKQEIWHGQIPPKSFCNLHSLHVENCASLLKVLPSYLLRSLQNLEVVILKNCDLLEEVFDLEGLDVNNEHVRLLSKLTKLSLIGLPKLRHICNKDLRDNLCFQNLKWLNVDNCGSLRNLFPSSMASDPMPLGGVEVMATGSIIFPQLTHLSLESLPNLTSVYPGCHSLQQLDHGNLDMPFGVLFNEKVAFPSLELLNISGLDNVKKIWHNQLLEDSFSQLKEIRVASCGKLLNIFPSSMLNSLQNLQLLRAVDCSSLEVVYDMEWINVEEAVSATQLSKLVLYSLPNLKHIWNKDPYGILTFENLKLLEVGYCQSLKYLFPASLVRDLVQLQDLQVSSCGVEELVAKENGAETAPRFVFPVMTSLRLTNLQQFKSFYPGTHTSEWPLLKKLEVRDCDRVKIFAYKFPTFQEIHMESNVDITIQQPLALFETVAFPNLDELTLDSNSATEIQQEQFPVESICKLRVLNVLRYGDNLVAIPSFMLHMLHNLEKLNVRRCGSVKEVVQLEELVDEESHAMALAKLREVQLHDLPELTHLCKENFKRGPRFQNLETLEVWNCDRLISLVPSSVTFQNLATLDVWSCGSLVNLLPPSTAKSLVQLKNLKVGGSDMMKEVVSGGGGEATDEIAFCKLEHIALVCLANLTSFCSGGYTFTFPSLDHLVVEECPKMEVFSQGFSTTPRLEKVDVADNEWHWEGDLNTTIQKLFIQLHG